jgi:microcystin-dependent protein
MSEPYIGEMRMFGGNFAPLSWARCDGQLLSISQNDALFALIGTTYGGDGVNTFALPDLRGRIPIGMGAGPGLSNRVIGESSGTENVTLTEQNTPKHSHALLATLSDVSSASVNSSVVPGKPVTGSNPSFYVHPADGKTPPTPVTLAPSACSQTSGNQPHNNIMPSLCVTFIIALFGIFPTQS